MECRIDDLDDPRSQLPRGVSGVGQTGVSVVAQTGVSGVAQTGGVATRRRPATGILGKCVLTFLSVHVATRGYWYWGVCIDLRCDIATLKSIRPVDLVAMSNQTEDDEIEQ